MERINLSEILRKNRNWNDGSKESWLQWVLIAAMTDQPMKHFRAKEGEDAILEVELKINGREIKLADFIGRLHEHFERRIAVAVTSVVDERIEKEMEKLTVAVDECHVRILKAVKL